MKKITYLSFLLCLSFAMLSFAQSNVKTQSSPIMDIKRIADKLIRNTPFTYRLAPVLPDTNFNNIVFMNLKHNFPTDEPAIAYAISSLYSPVDTTIHLQISHSDGMKIWLNKTLVYEKKKDGPAEVVYKERAIDLNNEFSIRLKKGGNKILLKSETKGDDWSYYLRPKENIEGLELRVDELPFINNSMGKFTNWLLIGPFPNLQNKEGERIGLDQIFEPETEFVTAKLYNYNDKTITWSIPKIEIHAEGFGSTLEWGDNNFSWNYHAGGTAWAMGVLGKYIEENKYINYSRNYSDFFIGKRPYLKYQKYETGGLDYGDCRIWESHMLDFTAAPGLVYTFWLNQQDDLPNKNDYKQFYNEILDYTLNKQVRLPEGNFTRETPRKYTTWADDMFMGIPFLVHSALLTSDKEKKEKLFNDAVNQVFAFNKQVFDENANLYRQAQYSDNKVKIPFWSRANGWALWAVTEILTYLPEDHPKRNQVLDHYKKHISALISHQDPKSGFWHNVLDKPDSFEETSGTAIFVMCIARGINNGWIKRDKYKSNVMKGWHALESNIEKDGTLHGTCVGTNMSENIKDYYTRPVADDDTHGIFPVIFAGIEVDKMLNRRR